MSSSMAGAVVTAAIARLAAVERGGLRAVARPVVSVVGGRLAPAVIMGWVALVKWGLMQSALAQARPDAGAAHVLVQYGLASYYGLTACFLSIVTALFLLRKPPVHKLSRRGPQVVALLAAYLPTALTLLPITVDRWWVTAMAVLLLAAGMACTVATVLVLGRCFGILPEVRGLVTTGPYRYVRHPLYTCEALAFLGLLLPVLSPVGLALYGAYAGLTVLRARYEEEALRAVFPAYASYRGVTRRFIPGVY